MPSSCQTLYFLATLAVYMGFMMWIMWRKRKKDNQQHVLLVIELEEAPLEVSSCAPPIPAAE